MKLETTLKDLEKRTAEIEAINCNCIFILGEDENGRRFYNKRINGVLVPIYPTEEEINTRCKNHKYSGPTIIINRGPEA